MTHWAHLNIWPDELIRLQQEIPHHPRLVERLQKHGVTDWEVRIAEVALYCEVIVDGDYLPEHIQKLCGILEKKLMERREDNRGILIIN
jgi:hypothetical protein